MISNYDGHPLLCKCFFCKVNDAQKKYVLRIAVNETLHKDAVSHEYKQYKLRIPRCSDCAKIQLKLSLVTAWVILSACFALIPLFYLSMKFPVDFATIAGFIVIIAIFVWSIVINTRMRRKYPNQIKPFEKAAEYLRLIKCIGDERGESNK